MQKIILALVIVGLASSIADAQTATQDLESYLDANICTKDKDTSDGCLTVLTNNACASGCIRRGYTWTPDPKVRPHPEPHMTMAYLKLLRNAAIEAPGRILRDGLSFGYTLEALLYHQIQVFLIDKSARYYSETRVALSHAAVQSGSYGSNTVDPKRFWMVAFGNEAGAAQAMGQGDYALWLLTLATSYANAQRAEKIDYYLRLSQAAFRAFLVRHDEGGVRNNKRSYRCYGTQYCYWFHSGYPNIGWPQCVLNKHLNATRNILWAHAELAAWRDKPINGVPLPVEFNQHVGHLRELGRGGLDQIAYGSGHAADHSAPPNLKEFLQNSQQDPQTPSVKRYNSWYRFDMPAHSPANGGTQGRVCHYHYYALQVFSQILTTISTDAYYKSDPDFIALYYKLLYNRSSGDTRTCNNRASIPPSKKVMRGIALAELYYGGRVYESWPEPNKSSFPNGHCDAALWFRLPDWYTKHPPNDPDAPGIVETRRFFDAAYKGCSF